MAGITPNEFDKRIITECDGFIIEGRYENGFAEKAVEQYRKQPERFDIRGRIALVDADLLDNGTRHPNLALMKISGYLKEQGCIVRLIEDYSELYGPAAGTEGNDYSRALEYDAIYISKVFDFTKIDEGLTKLPNVYCGGTGFYFEYARPLPAAVEHHAPDYKLYENYINADIKYKNKLTWYNDYLNFSIGFATRGCFRKCEFCVNKHYNGVSFHSHISEWLDPSRPYIYLWDDNILAYPHWKDVFLELKATGKRFQFRQGLDIRLMTDEKAKVLSEARYYGDFIFAFDHLEEAPQIEKGLAIWRRYCTKETKLYVLAGFDSQDETEIVSVFERIRILMKYGCLPYIMRHEFYNKSPYKGMFIQLARWCNQPKFFKNMSFREYCEQCQLYHKTKGTLCAPMRVMTEFEEKFPEIAGKYFDLRFSEQPYVIRWRAGREAQREERRKAREEKERRRAERLARKQEKDEEKEADAGTEPDSRPKALSGLKEGRSRLMGQNKEDRDEAGN